MFGNKDAFMFFLLLVLPKIFWHKIRQKYKGNSDCNLLAVAALALENENVANVHKAGNIACVKTSTDTQKVSSALIKQTVEIITQKGNNDTTQKILNTSLRGSNTCKCSNYIKQWYEFTGVNSIITINPVLNFLSNLSEKGNCYSDTVSEKFALATVMTVEPYQSLSTHLVVIILIIAVYNIKSSITKTQLFVWMLYLDILKTVVPMYNFLISINAKNFIVTTGWTKMQLLLKFHVNNMAIRSISVTFISSQPLKNLRMGYILHVF